MKNQSELVGSYNIVLQDINGSTINIKGASLIEMKTRFDELSHQLKVEINDLGVKQINIIKENIKKIELALNDNFSPLDTEEFEEDVIRLTKNFHGRQSERILIIDFIEHNNSGSLFLFGSPGIGKSSLMAMSYAELVQQKLLRLVRFIPI